MTIQVSEILIVATPTSRQAAMTIQVSEILIIDTPTSGQAAMTIQVSEILIVAYIQRGCHDNTSQ